MNLLKKIVKSPIAIAFMLILALSSILTACGDPYKDLKIVLPDSVAESGLVLELDENNTASTSFTVSLEGAPSSVSRELMVSTSSDRVLATIEYLRGDSSELTLNVTGIVNNVQVTITSEGQKSASFYVSSVKRVTGLQQSQDLSSAYAVVGTPVTLTSNLVTFEPADTTERDVDFILPDGTIGASLENNVLLVSEDYASPNNTIEVIAVSRNNSQVTTRVELQIIEPVTYESTYFYSNSNPMEEIELGSNREITIANNLPSRNSLLINVTLSSKDFEVSYKFKYANVAEVVSSTVAGNTYSFTIRTKGEVGSDELTFEIKHKEFDYSVTTEKLIISAYDTVSQIRTYREGELVETAEGIVTNFDVYDFYANVRGLELSFVIGPTTVPADDRGLTIELRNGASENFIFYNGSGNVITPTQNEDNLDIISIVSGTTIYVVAKENVTAAGQITVVSDANPDVSVTFTLTPMVGAKAVAFGNAVQEEDGTYSYYLTSNQAMTKNIEFLVYPTNINLGEVQVIASGNAFEVVSSTPRYEGTTTITVNDEQITYNKYSIEIVSKAGFEEIGEIRIRLSNGQLLRAKVEVFEALEDAVISVPSPQQTSSIGNVLETTVSGQDIFVASIKRGETVGLNVNTNTNVSISYDFYGETILGDADPYADAYQNLFLDTIPTDGFVTTSGILNALYLNNYNQLIVSNEGKVLVRASVTGYQLDEATGEKVEKIITRYFVIESYIPITSMLLSSSSRTLYSEDSVGSANIDSTKTTFNLVFNNGNTNNQPTYNKLTWNIGYLPTEDITEDVTDKNVTITYRSDSTTDTRTVYTVTFSSGLTSVEISAKATYQLVAGGIGIASVITDTLLVTAREFGQTINRSFLLTIRRANKVENIILENVTEENGIYLEIDRGLEGTGANPDQIFDINAYADTSNNPLNTNLIYEFFPNDGTEANLITVNRTTGLVTLSGNQTKGGSGYIRIAPEDSFIDGRYIAGDEDVAKYIPITIADGRSRETSYRVDNVNNLRQWIQNYPELYYTLTIDITDQPLTTPLDTLDGNTVEFNGGLFGRLEGEDTCRTIILNGTSLFTNLGANAVIEDFTLQGEATFGFVAQENNGTIRNVTVDTWQEGAEYKPSTVTNSAEEAYTGGLVAVNNGTISNVKFYGSISNLNASAYVGGIAGHNTGTIEYAEVEFYRYSVDTKSTYQADDKSGTIGGLVGYMSSGALNFSYAYSYVKITADDDNIVLNGAKVGILVGELAGGNVNACFGRANTANFVGVNESTSISRIENAYMYAYAGENEQASEVYTYRIIASYREIAEPSTYPDMGGVYNGISFGSDKLWNFAGGINGGYPYFNAIMQDDELDNISEFSIYNTDLTLTDGNGNVIFFYYEPNNMTLTDTENAVLAGWNTLNYRSLFGVENTSSIRITVGDAPIYAGADYLRVQDVNYATFTFSVFSKYDYSLRREFSAVIMYKILDFKLTYAGTEITDSNTDISIKYGNSDNVSTSITTSRVAVNRAINLVQNDMNIVSNAKTGTTTYDDLIVGNEIGVHTIQTAEIAEFTTDEINVTLTLNINEVIDQIFKDIITTNFTKSFNVQLYNGADSIIADSEELTIEPIDSHAQSIEVTIYTDDASGEFDLAASILNDEQLSEEGYSEYHSVTIITEYTVDANGQLVTGQTSESTNYPGISVINIYKDGNDEIIYKEFSNGYAVVRIYRPTIDNYPDDNSDYYKHTYMVTFGLVDDNAVRNKDYNGQAFNFSLFAESTGISTNFNLIVETQKLSYINTTHYTLNYAIWKGETDNQRLHYTYSSIPQSLLAPGNEGLLNVELYPAYSNYSYIEVTSRTVVGSSYQVRLGLMRRLDGTNEFVRETTGYESFTGGIRIFNPNLDSDIGSLYLRTFIPSDVDADTVYELTVTAYSEDGTALKTDTYRLSVQYVAAPELSVNGGKQAIIARGGSGEVEIVVNQDQTIDSLSIDNVAVGTVSYDPLTYTIDESTGLKTYTTTIYFSTDLVPGNAQGENGDNFIIITATTSRTINGTVETAHDVVYVAVADFVINPDGTQLNTDAYNKDVLTVYVGTTQKLEFDFDVDFFLTNDSLASFQTYNYFNSNPINLDPKYDQRRSYIVNGFYDSMPYDFDYDSSNSVIVANFIDNLYYADTYNPDRIELSKVFNRQSGQVAANGYCVFTYDGSNLYVRGLQATTGSVNMLLRIPIQIPNGTDEPTKTYLEYYFTINVVLETNEDKPVIIDTAEKFINMVNSAEPLDYILTEDIYLLDYTPISTTNIRSFDGNNKTIHILSFNTPSDQTSVNLALFNEVLEGTTLKNIRVNVYYGGAVTLNMTGVTSVNVAGFAISNSGIITNCEVVSYSYVGAERPNPQTPGLTVNYNYSNIDVSSIQSRVAGFVITNAGSITNSRVGGTSLEIANGTAITPTAFNIIGQGDVAGFVYENSGIIASSFFMNGTITNQTSSGSDTATAGFAITNTGEIRLSYARGIYANDSEIHATGGGIETASVGAGFIYENSGIIEDSYSNIMLTTIGDKESGRLSAGFVYINNSSAVVRRSYSASRIENSNSTQMNFLGVDVNLDLQNYGLVENSYYYNSDTSLDDEYSSSDMESLYNTTVNRVLDPDVRDSFYGFAFSNSSVEGYTQDGVWYMTTRGPELVSANNIAVSSRILNVEETNEQGEIVDYSFTYADGYRYGSSKNPIIIRDETEFNQVFGGDTANVSSSVAFYYDLASNVAFGNYRIVDNIDLSNLLSDETGLTLRSTEMTLTPTFNNQNEINGLGLLDGNSFTISGIELVSTLGGSNTSYGLFKELQNGAVVMNLNLEIEGVNATGVSYVGALAGTVQDSRIINVSVASANSSEAAVIYGYNITGGVVGRVIGDSYLSNVSAENLTVIAGNEATNLTSQFYNRVIRSNVSYAGGVAGLIDIYTNINSYSFSNALSEPNVVALKATGIMSVYGATVGGVVGYLGPQTMLQDALFEVSGNDNNQKLIAYKFAAGGVVGENYGYIFMVRAEHDSDTQLDIENNYATYYNDPTSEDVNRGNLTLFEFADSTSYKPQYIGGIVGEFVTGKLEKSYSKINVRSSMASYAGGIIGGIPAKDNSSLGGLRDYGAGQTLSLSFTELYATGDVFASVGAGGIFGYIADGVWNAIALEKINAINYWSVPTEQGTEPGQYSVVENNNYINNAYDIYYMPEGSSSLNITLNQTLYDVNAIESFTTSDNTRYYLNKSTSSAVTGNYIINADVQKVSELKNSSNADYVNEMNKIFRNAGWDQEYWDTETDDSVPHIFPHLTFRIEPSVIYIREASDLELLNQYKNKTFIIIGNADSGIVPVGDWLATTKQGFTVEGFSGVLRGRDTSGNYGLDFRVNNSTNTITAPLFTSTFTGAQFSNFVIQNVGQGDSTSTDYREDITSAFVVSATGTTFEGITLENCSISPVMPDGLENEDSSEVAYYVGMLTANAIRCSFSNITFSGENNINFEVNTNTGENNNIHVYVGMMAGNIGSSSKKSTTVVSGIKFENSNININFNSTDSNILNKNIELNVGHIAGASGAIDFDLSTFEEVNDNIYNLTTQITNSQIVEGKNAYNLIDTLNAGAFFGTSTGVVDSNILQRDKLQNNMIVNFALYGNKGQGNKENAPITASYGNVGGLYGRITGGSKSQFIVEKASEDPFHLYINNDIKLNIVRDGTNSEQATAFYYGGAVGRVDHDLNINNIETGGTTTIQSSNISYVGGMVGYVGGRFTASELISGNSVDFTQTNSTAIDNIFGGIVAQINYVSNVEGVQQPLSSITSSINESVFTINSQRVYYGGFVGVFPKPAANVTSSSAPIININNSVAGGGVIVENSASLAVVGGLIGSMMGVAGKSSSSVVINGTLSVYSNIDSNLVYSDLQFKAEPTGNVFMGGILGIGGQGVTISNNYSLSSIIYPFARGDNSNIGVIVGAVNGSSSGEANNYYSNQLSLMVASTNESGSNVKMQNTVYNTIVDAVTTANNTLSSLITQTHYGSKLNPFLISGSEIRINNSENSIVASYSYDSEEKKYKWIIETKLPEVTNYLGSNDQDPFASAMPERKYFKLNSTNGSVIQNLNNLTLSNAAIFGDGASVNINTTGGAAGTEYITNTFISSLDEDSFVTGIKVYVDTRSNQDSDASHYLEEDVKDENGQETGKHLATAYYGGLVGINKGIVYACNAVNSSTRSNDELIEQTMGISGGISINNIPEKITYGDYEYEVNTLVVGGLVAINEATGYISDSFSMVDIVTDESGITNLYLGGLVGRNYGQIDSCYSTGYVQSNSNYTLDSSDNSHNVYSFSYDETGASVKNSYTIAKAKNSNYTFGLGVFGSGADSSNYYDITATERESTSGTATKISDVDYMATYTVNQNGTQVTMQTKILLDINDKGVNKAPFSTVKFAQDPTINYGYPYFGGTGLVTNDTSADYMAINTGDGTANNPFEIPSAGKWQQLTNAGNNPAYVTTGTTQYHMYSWNSYYELIYDIDFANTEITSIKPIGSQEAVLFGDVNNYFSGVFDGNNKTISNATIRNASNSNEIGLGLFGYTGNRTTTFNTVYIQNVILKNSKVSTFDSSDNVDTATSSGGIVGIARNTTIINCHVVNSDIEGFTNAGGILGLAQAGDVLIQQSSSQNSTIRSIGNRNYTNGSETDYVDVTAGGILGLVNDKFEESIYATITESFNTSSVIAGEEVANDTGFANSAMADSAYAGGIVGAGYIFRATFDEEEAEGIIDEENIESLITISNCYNTGSVRANANIPKPFNDIYRYYFYQKDENGEDVKDEYGNPILMQNADDWIEVTKLYLLHTKYENSAFEGDHNYTAAIYSLNIHMLMRQAYSSGISNNSDITACYNTGEVSTNEDDITDVIYHEAENISEGNNSRIDITLNSTTTPTGEALEKTYDKVSYTLKSDNLIGHIPDDDILRRDFKDAIRNGDAYAKGADAERHATAQIITGYASLATHIVAKKIVAKTTTRLLVKGATKVGIKIASKLAVRAVPVVGWAAGFVVDVVMWGFEDSPRSATYLLSPISEEEAVEKNEDGSLTDNMKSGVVKLYSGNNRLIGYYSFANPDNIKHSDIITAMSEDPRNVHNVLRYTGSFVSPIGYNAATLNCFSIVDSCSLNGNNYTDADNEEALWIKDSVNDGANTDYNKSLDELRDKEETYESTTINYTHIETDPEDSNYYIFRLDIDEITISDVLGDDEVWVPVSYRGENYVYKQERYDVTTRPEKHDLYILQIGDEQRMVSAENSLLYNLSISDDTTSGSILDKNHSFYRIWYKNSADFETPDDNTIRITNPYVVLFNDEQGYISLPLTEEGEYIEFSSSIYRSMSVNDFTNTGIEGFAGAIERGNIINNEYDYTFEDTKDYEKVTSTKFNDISIGQYYITDGRTLYIGEITNEIAFVDENDDNIWKYTIDVTDTNGEVIILDPYYQYIEENSEKYIESTGNPIFEGDYANAYYVYRSYSYTQTIDDETQTVINYVYGYMRERRISKDFISDSEVERIDKAIINDPNHSGSMVATLYNVDGETSPWTIDPDGVINDGLPYLKFVPMLVEQDVAYYGVVDNNYMAFSRPKENTGTSQEFSKEDFDSYNSRLTINNEYQRDENGNVYLGQIANEGADPTYFVYCETIYYDKAGNEVSANDNYTRVKFTYWTSWDDFYSKKLDGLKYYFVKNKDNAHGKLCSKEFMYF
ncbi:MAG TPA: hypothetical protein IAA62_01010 [Candidatus Caccopulliclostridium gallistercoris]|uniref:Uncharacterized protein n=1 Tax=Candidatus Caccopulliclostridium gallistercoris TaxID=2840719 RepID=A0A9D1NDI7_9FIRM|nr:hypothetical protein [Candidatus Caccopulliclostridium gallistercoris]